MIEGWHNDEYLVYFDTASEAARMTDDYGVRDLFPGLTVVGLRGWDDFILIDENQRYFTAPTVPLDPKYLAPYGVSVNLAAIKPDKRFTDKIKWYVKPLVFGGDPKANENMVWISHSQHVEAVNWWNKQYREVAAKSKNA
jgi:hypothetical protein